MIREQHSCITRHPSFNERKAQSLVLLASGFPWLVRMPSSNRDTIIKCCFFIDARQGPRPGQRLVKRIWHGSTSYQGRAPSTLVYGSGMTRRM